MNIIQEDEWVDINLFTDSLADDHFSIFKRCLKVAVDVIDSNVLNTNKLKLCDYAKLLYSQELDKIQSWDITDKNIDFNDEILEIIEIGNSELVDISVSGDQLFYANGILTKNSIGLVATCDMMIGLITSPELDEMNQIIFKQLKNRFGDVNKWTTFPIGVNKAQMRLYNLDNTTATVAPISTGGYTVETLQEDQSNDETLGYSAGSKSKRTKFTDFKV